MVPEASRKTSLQESYLQSNSSYVPFEKDLMKLYSTLTSYIIEDNGSRLMCSKVDGRLSVSPTLDVIPMDAEEVCDIVLVIGRLDIDGLNYILCVTSSTVVAELSDVRGKYPIHRIDHVKAILLDPSVSLDALPATGVPTDSSAQRLKQSTGKLLKFVQDKIGNVQRPFALLEEILRLFNDSPGFYFCFERDITQCTQRHFSNTLDSDERFFWNKLLLRDLLEETDKNLAKKWAVPIIQGSVRSDTLTVTDDPEMHTSLGITLISRRSVHRAGMRYLRRGIDSDSNVANFVETELILHIFDHNLSFVQIRGSVPTFWSQRGYKYRPPLTIDRPLEESMPYFTTHMQSLIEHYGSPLVVVNLVDQAGRELKLARSFVEHAVKFNSSDLHFVSFDLHRQCRGLKFDKINDLISRLHELLGEISYCWVDKTGEVVKTQRGVVRTNCIDCLDRTNLVQGAISQWVCMQQAQRLGLFGPLCEPPEALVLLLQNMWADNGDVISTQYAGTAALKGDVTRSGERRFTGIMKDGYNSASRYYLSHVRDSSRQKAINALLGKKDQGMESMLEADSDSEEDENVGRLVAETVHFLLPEGEVVVGGWALCDPQRSSDAADAIVLLTRTKLYIAVYDDDVERLADVKIVPLEDIKSIEIGRPSRSGRLYLRLSTINESWTLCAGKTRLFNNVAIRLKSIEEANEYAESIAEQICVTIKLCIDKDVPVHNVERMSLPKSSTAARKALTSVTAALKSRMFKPSPRMNATKLNNKNLEAEGQTAPAVMVDFDSIDASDSSEQDPRDFLDDMNSNTAVATSAKVYFFKSMKNIGSMLKIGCSCRRARISLRCLVTVNGIVVSTKKPYSSGNNHSCSDGASTSKGEQHHTLTQVIAAAEQSQCLPLTRSEVAERLKKHRISFEKVAHGNFLLTDCVYCESKHSCFISGIDNSVRCVVCHELTTLEEFLSRASTVTSFADRRPAEERMSEAKRLFLMEHPEDVDPDLYDQTNLKSFLDENKAPDKEFYNEEIGHPDIKECAKFPIDPVIHSLWRNSLDINDLAIVEQNDMKFLLNILGIDRISSETLSRFNIRGHVDKRNRASILYPRYGNHTSLNAVPVGLKVIRRSDKVLEKEVYPNASQFCGIFGYHLTTSADRLVVLTTNERDALAVYDATGGVLTFALPHGRRVDLQTLPYLARFEQIFLWFPPQHQDFAREWGYRLDDVRCRLITTTERPVELVRNGKQKDVRLIIAHGAARLRERGFISASDIRDEIKSDLVYSSVRQNGLAQWKRFAPLNKYLQGLRPRELTVLTGGIRTTFCSFEMPEVKILKWMLVQFAGVPLYRSDYGSSVDVWLDRFERTKGPLTIMKTSDFREKSVTQIAEVIRNYVINSGCQHLVIDNLQFLVNQSTTYKEQSTAWDRFYAQDRFVGHMRSLATQTGVHVTMVVHPRKTDADTDLDIQHFGGSARVTQEADNVLALQRRRDENDRGKFRKFLYILKNRYGGSKVETDQLEMVFHPETYCHTIIDHNSVS
ncbi:unnamed protein product [Cylicocyclus nassatus]|uniref:SAC domain-containing protein n=1 Tax=Cylicocyclus nassatus TaxID=53992 RepID=A0AA36GQ81_CYLNA|nr:unnamed protein product [Cylicocyclus nassatus]